MGPNFDMHALRAMATGAELGSFARAASRLGRSQSAVSMQLKKLEGQAGRPLFRRTGRRLVPTEAGEALLVYARQILALNDEAAAFLGATPLAASVRMGLPQDLFEDVMADAIAQFSRRRPGVHVEVRAGRNYALDEEVRAGRLDVAVAFFEPGPDGPGTRVASLPMLWLGREGLARTAADDPVALALFDHPCLFRQAALRTLEQNGLRWRLSLTTPSLPGVWAALRSGHAVSVRTPHRIPAGICDVGHKLGLPGLPAIELRLLSAGELSPAAAELKEALADVLHRRVAARPSADLEGDRRRGTAADRRWPRGAPLR